MLIGLKYSIRLILFLCICCSIIFLEGCKKNETFQRENTILIDPAQAKKYAFSDVFDSISYIPIDTPLYSFFRRVEVNKNGIFLLDDENPACLHIYRLNGTYQHSICHKGEAAGEYSNIRDFKIDGQNNFVLLDRTRQKLMYYDQQGNFLKDWKYNMFVDAFQFVEDNYISLYCNNEMTVNKCRLVIADSRKKSIEDSEDLKKEFLPINSTTRLFLNFYDINNFVPYQKDMLFSQAYNDTIYKFDKDELNIHRIINFGNYGIPKEVFQKDFENVMVFRQFIEPKGYACNVNAYFEGHKFVVFLFEYQNKRLMAFLNKQTNELKIIKDFEDDLLARGIKLDISITVAPLFVPVAITGREQIVFALMQNSFQEGIETLKKDKIKWQKLIAENPNIESLSNNMVEENPVLLIATPK